MAYGITDELAMRVFGGLPTWIIGGLSLLIFYLPVLIVTLALHALLLPFGGMINDDAEWWSLLDSLYWIRDLTIYTALGRGEHELAPYTNERNEYTG